MPPESAKYLLDMLEAAETIELHVTGCNLPDFLEKRWLKDAVTWNLCVIGEAMSQLMRKNESLAHDITDSRKIIGLRNQLIHGYGVIDHEITWKIIEEKLPILKQLTVLLRT